MSTEATRQDRPEVGRDPDDVRALEEAIAAGHEVDSVRPGILRKTALGYIGLLVIGVVTVYVIQPWFTSRQMEEYPPPNPLAEKYGRIEPPAPRLQVDPKLDIYQHRKAEERLLTTYGWVDEKAGVVRIPIERAIDLLAQRSAKAAPDVEGKAPAMRLEAQGSAP